MINRRYLILYLLIGTIALLLEIYQVLTTYPHVTAGGVIGYSVISLCFYYLAYKVYHEKKDGEMM
jgi:hypothetical protein